MPLRSTCLCLLTGTASDGTREVLLGHKKTGLGQGKIVGLGGTSNTPKSSKLIGREQAQVGVPEVGSPTGVDVSTTGRVAIFGIGLMA